MLLDIKNSKIDKFAQKANYLHDFWIFMKVFRSMKLHDVGDVFDQIRLDTIRIEVWRV